MGLGLGNEVSEQEGGLTSRVLNSTIKELPGVDQLGAGLDPSREALPGRGGACKASRDNLPSLSQHPCTCLLAMVQAVPSSGPSPAVLLPPRRKAAHDVVSSSPAPPVMLPQRSTGVASCCAYLDTRQSEPVSGRKCAGGALVIMPASCWSSLDLGRTIQSRHRHPRGGGSS